MTTPDIPDRQMLIEDGKPAKVMHEGSTCYEGQRVEALRSWFVGEDGLTSVERELAASRERERVLSDEVVRVRTTETAAAHALDCLRQNIGLPLIQGEHPALTRGRILEALAAAPEPATEETP